ncbi:GvpL/GvpF family gas vesicle protein [Brevibacterium daeguense]|uniref:GvpL/GvpF family gas vesicle protein n=1 Tax=Brevibacterium daeguense TaxID=909936 RepID=A0ABP8EL10_9MICO|nr:GvpL/GvpF family gas vesicle protein [Brevibacterium daeguense]
MAGAASEALDGLYVYGIVQADANLPDDLVGVEGRPVSALAEGTVAALVTELSPGDEFGTPDGLLAHTNVLDTASRSVAVLPMTFGTVVPSAEELTEEVLSPRQAEFSEALRTVEGAVQFTVRARYLRDVALAAMIAGNPEIARLREAISGTSEDETRNERIRLGELIVATFDRMRPTDAESIREALSPFARDVVHREAGQAEDIVELALLVPRERQSEFENAVESIAKDMHEEISFRLVGPQAPYDFVNGD